MMKTMILTSLRYPFTSVELFLLEYILLVRIKFRNFRSDNSSIDVPFYISGVWWM